VLIVFIVAALITTAAVSGFTFWQHGSLVAFLLALFTAHALVFVLVVIVDPRGSGRGDVTFTNTSISLISPHHLSRLSPCASPYISL
jgi:hypothetical protein